MAELEKLFAALSPEFLPWFDSIIYILNRPLYEVSIFSSSWR